MASAMKRIVIFCFLFFFISRTFASHIVGGEIYYDYLGGNKYKITLKIYRDCFNGIPPLPNPARVSIFDKFGTEIDTLRIPQLSLNNVPPSINNPCIQPPGTVCVEEGLYIDTIVLLPKIGGYDIVWQGCCRNNSIININNPGNTGSTYWEHIPGSEVVAVNSSPRFTNFPPIYTCDGLQIKFNHVATDPDGDVLVYALINPYDGCAPSSSCFNSAPPFTTIGFIPPYSGTYPMSSNPVLNINPSTGFLNGTPNMVGQWVACVCVKEYRGGNLIGTHYRDFQFNVVSCQVSVASVIQSQLTGTNSLCQGNPISFNNQSVGGNVFHWDFGVASLTSDTSNIKNPTYMFPDTGQYVITLITNPGTPCTDTTTQTFYIYPTLNPTLVPIASQCIKNNNFSFTLNGSFTSYATFNWNFSAAATPVTSTLQNPVGITYAVPGHFPVTVVVKQAVCTKTLTDTARVFQNPTPNFNPVVRTVCDSTPITISNISATGFPTAYNWQFSNGVTLHGEQPSFMFTPPGVYNLTLSIITTAGCVDTTKFTVPAFITVNPKPNANFKFSPDPTSIFDPDISFTDLSSGANTWNYNFGDGANSTDQDPMHTYTDVGDYYVTQTVTNSFGCLDTITKLVQILPEFRLWVPNAFTPKNKDERNDVWLPVVFGVTEYDLSVWDRWGQCIFKTNDTQKGWDGKFKGANCEEGVYVWLINFKNSVSLRHEQHYGSVTIVK
jgi:gliding motility-associated-like protein